MKNRVIFGGEFRKGRNKMEIFLIVRDDRFLWVIVLLPNICESGSKYFSQCWTNSYLQLNHLLRCGNSGFLLRFLICQQQLITDNLEKSNEHRFQSFALETAAAFIILCVLSSRVTNGRIVFFVETKNAPTQWLSEFYKDEKRHFQNRFLSRILGMCQKCITFGLISWH